MKYVFYIGDFKAGIMDAQCQLVLGNCKVLNELGYKVILIGNDSSLSVPNNILNSKIEVDGFEVYNICFVKNIKNLLKSFKIHKEIKRVLLSYPKPDFIINYGSPAFAMELHLLSNWCKNNKSYLISNCVDLSIQLHGTVLQRLIKSLDRKYRNVITFKRVDGIIAVSTNIGEYFNRFNKCPTVIIPPLKDVCQLPKQKYNYNKVRKLVYIGVPFPIDGRIVDEHSYKDRIDLFIDIICQIRNEVPSFCLDIYGLTKEQYEFVVSRHIKLISQNSDIINFHGRVEHKEALSIISDADYSVVYRLKNQMTMAGFSSKLVESISCGIPLILTDTSDYLKYLKDGETCFVVDENVNQNSYNVVKHALSIDDNKLFEMKKKCYEFKQFDFHNYSEIMKAFIDDVSNKL